MTLALNSISTLHFYAQNRHVTSMTISLKWRTATWQHFKTFCWIWTLTQRKRVFIWEQLLTSVHYDIRLKPQVESLLFKTLHKFEPLLRDKISCCRFISRNVFNLLQSHIKPKFKHNLILETQSPKSKLPLAYCQRATHCTFNIYFFIPCCTKIKSLT